VSKTNLPNAPAAPLDRINRERERINALHDAIAIIAVELCWNGGVALETIVRRLREEAEKATTEYPPDGRGMMHPWPAELVLLCETIERFARKPPPSGG